jgi:hypothetical protein
MKNSELAERMMDRITDLNEQIFQKNEQVATLATTNQSFNIVRIKELCDEVNIILNQIEILQEFIDLQVGPDISTLSNEQLN